MFGVVLLPLIGAAGEEDHLTSAVLELKTDGVIRHEANVLNFMQHERLEQTKGMSLVVRSSRTFLRMAK